MRLIDADLFLSEELYKRDDAYYRNTFESGVRSVLQAIANAPTVDAVEIVRCRDCVHMAHREIDGGGSLRCCHSGLFVGSLSDFCSYGKREGDEI